MKKQIKHKAKGRVLFQGKYIRLVKKRNWEYIERHNCSGIVIIVSMTAAGKVVLTEQFRPPVGKRVIEFPAGLMGDQAKFKKETVSNAAQRELLEETGYLSNDIMLLTKGPVSGGSSADLVNMVIARGLKKVGPGGGDASERIKVHEVTLGKMEGWLARKERQGCLIEPKIYSGLYFLNKYNDVLNPVKPIRNKKGAVRT